MTITACLGVVGTFIGLVRALPQLLSVLRSHGALGVSVDTAATSAIVGFGWATYGHLTGQPFVSFATGASAVVFLLITIFSLCYGRKLAELKIAPLWFMVLCIGTWLNGEHGLGFILPVSILGSNVPQLLVALKEESLVDLSLGTWLFSISDGSVWGLYALLAGDSAILIFGILQFLTSGLIVLLKLMDMGKVRQGAV